MGLPGAPKIKFGNGDTMKSLKNAPRGIVVSSSDSEDDMNGQPKADSASKKGDVRTKYDRMFERKNQDILADHYTKLIDDGRADSEQRHGATVIGDEFMSAKRLLRGEGPQDEESDVSATGNSNTKQPKVVTGPTKDPLLVDSKRREKLLKSKKKLLKFKESGKKLVYDEDGNAHEIYELEDEDKFISRGPADAQKLKFLQEEQQRLQTADAADKAAAKVRRKEKKAKRKLRERAEQGQSMAAGVQLAPVDDVDGSEHVQEEDSVSPQYERSPEPVKKQRREQHDEESDHTYRPRDSSRKGVQWQESLDDLEAAASSLLQ